MPEDTAEDFEKCSVKELRRHAALRSVPLTQISAAIEKRDLISLILRAGPVRDQYGVGAHVKVHSAESIAWQERFGKVKVPKEKKVKKKKRKSTSSSSRSGSSGKKRKRIEDRKLAKGRRKKSRSPSLEMIIPTITIGPREKSVLTIEDTSMVSIPSAINAPVARSTPAERAKAKAKAAAADPSLAQRGMTAAAALGFDVLPKAAKTSLLAAPAPGLRPSINAKGGDGVIPSLGSVMGAQGIQGSRVCMNYMSYGNCQKGDNCPDAHITDPEEEMRVRARFKEQECSFGANCTRKNCMFRHPGEIMEEHKSVPSGMGLSLRNTAQGLQIEWQ